MATRVLAPSSGQNRGLELGGKGGAGRGGAGAVADFAVKCQLQCPRSVARPWQRTLDEQKGPGPGGIVVQAPSCCGVGEVV